MAATNLIEIIQVKYLAIAQDLDERGKRRWAAAEARSLGWGGITLVSEATGISDRTIRNGMAELNSPETLDSARQRRVGGGRKRLELEYPGLLSALDSLIEDTSRGDPQSTLRWTVKSTRNLAEALSELGFKVGSRKVAELLHSSGYSLQSNRKTVEGKQHPGRDSQFKHIATRTKAYRQTGQAAISVDTKKKETLGNIKNAGCAYRKKGVPRRVNTHDFPDKELGKAVPYGVYDIRYNEAGVSVGVSKDTAEFAVAAIRRWWRRMGSKRHPKCKRLLITADCGGSNSPRTRLWRWELQRFANEAGIKIEVCHYPPGTSKWNKIEHRLFCHITQNWRGIPLETHEIVVELIGATRTKKGLEVHAWLDEKQYQKARKITEEQMQEIIIKRSDFHGEWNYQIIPQQLL